MSKNLEIREAIKRETSTVRKKLICTLKAVIYTRIATLYTLSDDTEDYRLKDLIEAYDDLEVSLKEVSPVDERGVETFFDALVFMELISTIEIYFVNVIHTVIKAYPVKAGKISFELKNILDKSKEEIIAEASEKYVYGLMYKKADEVLKGFCDICSIDQEKLKPFWGTFVEAKARRDLGAHNNWLCNAIYLRKVGEFNIQVDSNMSEDLIPTHEYMHKTINELSELIAVIDEELLNTYK